MGLWAQRRIGAERPGGDVKRDRAWHTSSSSERSDVSSAANLTGLDTNPANPVNRANRS